MKTQQFLSPFSTCQGNSQSEQIFKILIEAGRATSEFQADSAWSMAKEVIAKAWRVYPESDAPVEKVEDWIEEILQVSPYKNTAKTFIIARDRKNYKDKMIANAEVKKVDQYLSKLDWTVKENSNMSYSLQGLNHYLSGSLSKTYWLHNIYSDKIREAHEEGDMHIHDLGQISVYCVGWDLSDLLLKGFRGVPGKLETRPPKHFRSALGQVVNFFYTMQGEAAGAQAFSNFDTLLAPFIRYDNLSSKKVKQCIQEFVFNINVPTRVGFQTPFTNITLDLFCPNHFKNLPVVWGGEYQKETYGEFEAEMDLFNKAFFEVMMEGDAKGRILTFPIPTVNLDKNFDWDHPKLKGLWEITGKYGIPYFANFVNSDMNPEDTRSMCCRLRIDNTKLEKRGGGLFGANPLTGSVGVVTINLPKLAHLAENEDDFFEKLTNAMDLAKESLEIKRNLLEKLTHANLYPYTSFYLKNIKDKTKTFWKNHFSTIGMIGMNECCMNLIGEGIVSEKGKSFALKTMDFMRERIVQYQTETGNFYNLEATPAEGTSFRLAQKDKSKFENIHVANEDSETPFYTNSVHVPVNHTDDPFELLDHQNDLQTKFTGGTVIHLFLGENISETENVKNLVKKIAQTYEVPYFSITPTFSICQTHGYLSGEQKSCPTCGAKTEIYSRIVGYIRPIEQWNDGKQAEFELRKTLNMEDQKVIDEQCLTCV